MNKDVLLAVVIGAAVLMVVSKQAQAKAGATGSGAPLTNAQKQAAGLLYTPAQTKVANVNGDMWTKLLGDGWRNMVKAQNADGTKAFVTNSFGQVFTGDGKPVGTGDAVQDWMNVEGVNLTMPTENYLGQISQFDQYVTPQILQWDTE